MKSDPVSFPGVTPATSLLMSKIRGKDTKPELVVRKYLFKEGFRYRVHQRKLPGSPDVVLKKYNTVIFIHGCFWHQHPGCKQCRMPNTRQEYWVPKITGNIARDEKNMAALKDAGWNVITVWECDLKKGRQEQTLKALAEAIKSNKL